MSEATTQKIDQLVYTAVFGETKERDAARIEIFTTAYAKGIKSASIHNLYAARGKGVIPPTFTVPAINIRCLTYDVARAAFRVAKKLDTGAFILEIARSEMGYTLQRPMEYAAVVLAAALREQWEGPVFLQGDHYQFSASKYPKNPGAETNAIRELISESLTARFLNIDIDASTLVDMSKSTIAEQQRLNATLSADMCAFIRKHQPNGVTVSVGGEIGEVGTHVTSLEEVTAYQDLYAEELKKLNASPGPMKISINTGTSHGGKVDSAGKLQTMAVRFDLIESTGKAAREQYGMAGVVQHGASTLPESEFDKFPSAGACEIHLATGFQNLVLDHPAFPEELTERIVAYCTNELMGEKKEGDTTEQFIYKMRKKALCSLKRPMWDMPQATRDAIMQTMEAKFSLLFTKLNVTGTRALVREYAILDTTPPTGNEAGAPIDLTSGMAANEGE